MTAAPTDDYIPTDDDDPRAPPKARPTPITSIRPLPNCVEPLRGLQHLGPIAVSGRKRLLGLAAQQPHWIWQHIALAGTIVLIASEPSGGKTTLLFLILAARMNLGRPVKLLGRPVEPAPEWKRIVLIEGEHSESSTARKLVKSLGILDVDDLALERIIVVARKAVRLGSPEWDDVAILVKAGLVSDIAIDTVARVAPADGNDEREQVAIFDLVAQTIELSPDEAKPVTWAIAHTRKNNVTGGVGDVSGSTQRTGQADSVLLMKATKEQGRTVASTVTFAKLREDPDEYPMPVSFSITRDADGLHHLVEDSLSSELALADQIIAQLTFGPKTKNALRETLKRNIEDMEAAISELFMRKRLTTCTVKVNGREYKAFKLRPPVAAPEDPEDPRNWDPSDAL